MKFEHAILATIASFLVGFSLAMSFKHTDKPVVHHMKEGFICITYRETMVCGQGTSTHPSQNDTSPDETLSVTYSILQAPYYSTEF